MSDELNSPRILCQQCMRHEGSGVYVSAHDLTTLRTQLAAMTAERDAALAKVAVALRMLIEVGKGHAIANTMDRAGESTECVYFGTEQTGNSLMTPEAATRRAIVRAAAAIGESK